MSFDFGKGVVANLVGLIQVWVDIRVRRLQIGMEWGNNRLVSVIGEIEDLGAIWIRFEALNGVVDDGKAVEMLSWC